MPPSVDALDAFVEAVATGSFSSAARKLGRSQSTISMAIANLEVDLGVTLFDRSRKRPELTLEGRALLPRAEAILDAHEHLRRAAADLLSGTESVVTVALSDTYQSDRFETALTAFQDRFPNTQLECLIAECGDLVDLVQRGRAQLGFVEQQAWYPKDIAAETVDEVSELAIYVASSHPLAALTGWTPAEKLRHCRELRLSTVRQDASNGARGTSWSAPSYLMLMELAQLGLGWAALPRWLADRFAGSTLQELRVRGWPKTVHVDALWLRRGRPGPATSWLLQEMLR